LLATALLAFMAGQAAATVYDLSRLAASHDDVPFRIGHQRTDGSTGIQPFHGEISGFAVYAKALDHSEVLARFALGVPEPTTAIMALLGAVFLLARWRKTRNV
jgi:hypothetical protein